MVQISESMKRQRSIILSKLKMLFVMKFTVKYDSSKSNSLEYPNTNPQSNNTKDVKHPKRSTIISKTATLIQTTKKSATKKLHKLRKKTKRKKEPINLN